MLKQRDYLYAFGARFMIKESFRIIFLKPPVVLKEFKYIKTPSLPELINLHIFKIKFKHLGYVWRVIENTIISTYLTFEMDLFSDKQQIINISSLISVEDFHFELNLVICALSYLYTLVLIFRIVRIIKFIPVLSDQTVFELQNLKTSQIRSDKIYNYYWQPSTAIDSNVFDKVKQICKNETDLQNCHTFCQEENPALQQKKQDQEVKHVQFIKQKNNEDGGDNKLCQSYTQIQAVHKPSIKFHSHKTSSLGQEFIQDHKELQKNIIQQTEEPLQTQNQNDCPDQNTQPRQFNSSKQQNTFLKSQKNQIFQNKQINCHYLTRNKQQDEENQIQQQASNYIESSQIQFQINKNINKTKQSYQLNNQDTQNIPYYKIEASSTQNQTKNQIILFTNCDDSVININPTN